MMIHVNKITYDNINETLLVFHILVTQITISCINVLTSMNCLRMHLHVILFPDRILQWRHLGMVHHSGMEHTCILCKEADHVRYISQHKFTLLSSV